MDLSAVAGIISSLKTANDLARAMLDLRDWQAAQGKVADLTRAILDAQSGALAAQAKLAELQDEIATLKAALRERTSWEDEKRRYELVDFGGGTFAYSLRGNADPREPHHLLCPSCFQSGRKSILQQQGRTAFGQQMYRCYPCAETVFLGNRHHDD